MAMGKARSSAVKKFNPGNTSDLFLLIIMCSFLPTRNARLIPHLTEACKSYLDSNSGGARMSTSGGLINRDLEQMSKINDEIMFFL